MNPTQIPYSYSIFVLFATYMKKGIYFFKGETYPKVPKSENNIHHGKSHYLQLKLLAKY